MNKFTRLKSILGIDIGTRSIKIVEMNKKGLVEGSCKGLTPEGVLVNGYNEQSVDSLANAIIELVKVENMKSKHCALCISDNDMIIREIKLPFMKHYQILENVSYEMDEYLHIDNNNYVIEYRILEEFRENNARTLRVLAIAVPRKIVLFYMDVLKKAGLSIQYMDIGINSRIKLFSKALKEVQNDINYNSFLLDLGVSTTQITVFHNGKYFIDRVIPWTVIGENGEEILLNKLTDELGRVIEYCYKRAGENFIDSVYLMGGGAFINGINEHIQKSFNLRVFFIDDILKCFFNDKYNASNAQVLFGLAIGATLRERG